MSQISTKFLADLSVLSGSSAAHGKIGSGAATSAQALFSDGAGGTSFRSIISTDLPGTITSNTTGTASNITATTNTTLTTLSSLALPTSQLTGTIVLTTQVSGILPVANGGTGDASFSANQVILGGTTSTGPLAQVAGGTTGYVLTSTGTTAAPTWQAPATSGTVTSVSVVSANGFAGTVATATSTPAITIETTLNTPVLAGNGTALIAATTTGTGSTVVLSASPTFTGTVTMAALSATTGSFSGAVNMNSNQINNLANGTASNDAVNLSQLQSAINGLTWKGPVSALANTQTALTGGATLTIDGYSVQNGNYVMLTNQTTPSQDGVYLASGIGSSYVLTQVTTGYEAPTAVGDAYLVLNGTVYGNTAYQVNGLSPVTFIQFAGPNTYSFSSPLSLTGNVVSLVLATNDIFVGNGSNVATAVAMSGDATIVASGALTLATVNSNVGSFGSSTSIPSFTVNAKGLITAASGNAVIAPAGTLSGTTLNSTVVSSSLTSVGTIGTGVWQGTPIAIAYGGTGQATAQLGFDALSPLTTAGDTLYYNGTHNTRLPIGSTGQILTVVSGEPAWANPAATSIATEDVLTLNSTDITNQYKDLLNPATGSSASVNSIELGVVGGPEQQKTVDYTVALTGGVGGVTRITFAGGLATGGASALVSGDILMVSYTYA